MEELMKNFYTQFTDKELQPVQYKRMMSHYGDNMAKFVKDF